MAFAYCVKGQALLRSGPSAAPHSAGARLPLGDNLSCQHLTAACQLSLRFLCCFDFPCLCDLWSQVDHRQGCHFWALHIEVTETVWLAHPSSVHPPCELIGFQGLWGFSINLFCASLSILMHFRGSTEETECCASHVRGEEDFHQSEAELWKKIPSNLTQTP